MTTQDELQGYWQRDWIKAPGVEDNTTRVHWMQAGSLFADVRIPRERPDVRGVYCLADMALQDIKPLLRAEGFAGHTTVVQSQCTWHRHINWHGKPEHADTGLMSFDASGALIEDGVHVQYREQWRQVPQDAPLRGMLVRSGEMSGVLIENDTVFLLGLGHSPEGTTEALAAAVAQGTAEPSDLHRLFESEYVMGYWDGPFGVARLSTNPFHEGHVALERKAGFIWHALAFDGREVARPIVID